MGLSGTGYSARTEQEIFDEIAAELRLQIDPNLNLTASSVMGALVAIVANKIAEMEETAAEVYSAYFPSTAEEASLDDVCSITGTVRRPATFARCVVEVTTTAATTITAGSIVAQAGNETIRFIVDDDIVAGGAGTYYGTATAENSGPLGVVDGTLTVIVTPIANWDATDNQTTVDGLAIETDAELRQRRQQEIQRSGGSTVDAIEADISALSGIVTVIVYENTSAVTDGDGRPPHSFEALVWDSAVPAADDDEIAQVIYDQKPAGILSYSATADSGTATRADGSTETIEFSRATATEIYVDCTVSTNSDYAGDTAVQQAVADFINSLQPGDDVIYTRLYAAIYAVEGVTDVTALTSGTVDPPLGTTNIAIGVRDVAVVGALANVGVTS